MEKHLLLQLSTCPSPFSSCHVTSFSICQIWNFTSFHVVIYNKSLQNDSDEPVHPERQITDEVLVTISFRLICILADIKMKWQFKKKSCFCIREVVKYFSVLYLGVVMATTSQNDYSSDHEPLLCFDAKELSLLNGQKDSI